MTQFGNVAAIYSSSRGTTQSGQPLTRSDIACTICVCEGPALAVLVMTNWSEAVLMSVMMVPFLECGYHAPSLSPHRFHFLEISRMAGALLDQPFIPAPVQVWWLHSEYKKRRKGVEQEDYRLEGHAVQCQASWKASHDFDKLAAASRVCTHTSSPTPPCGCDPHNPHRPDCDCGNFSTHREAQACFIAAGGPDSDPHRLDGDKDGLACESLP